MKSDANYSLLEPSRHYKNWAKSAVSSLASFAAGTYFCLTSADPFATRAYASLGTMVFVIGLVCYSLTKPAIVEPLKESLLDNGTRTSIKTQLNLCSIAGVLNCLGYLALFMGYYYDPSAIGVTTAVLLGTGLTSTVFSHFLFDEKVTKTQLGGMATITVGLIVLVLQNSAEGTTSAFLAGFTAICMFTARELMSRGFERRGMNQAVVSMISLFTEGMFGLYLGMFIAVFGSGLNISSWDACMVVIGGAFNALGMYYLNKGIMTGYTGPTVCISNMASLVIVAMQFLHSGSIPSFIKSIGMCLSVIGLCVILLGESFLAQLGFKAKVRKSL